MHAASDRRARIGKLLDVPEKIDSGASNRRQEDAQVGTGHKLWEHAAGLLEQDATKCGLRSTETLRNAGQIPDGIDGDLHDRDGAALVHHAIVALDAAGRKRGLNLD